MKTSGDPGLGLLFFGTDESWPLVEFAEAAEERGFDALALPEHSHMPVASRYPLGELPDRYRRVLDPYIGMSMVAARTTLEIATCVSLLAQHDPITHAKTVATLDHLSGGRLTLGIGYGWNRAELADHGRRFDERRAVVRDHVTVMRALWRDEVAEYAGSHASVSPSWAWPKPVAGSVPMLLGVQPTERGRADVVGFADGWMPGSDDQLPDGLPALCEAWERAGRSGTPTVWPKINFTADDTDLLTRIERCRALGVDRILLDLQSVSRDDTMRVLDRYAALVEKSRR
ncbi:putative F420-dependent oxidoreductase [Prauserella sediminis]|uniref:Putative F420-dependent oxidoreductase n=1 Tax=Prauserella sediminis TaxID=577680 RepID=A0A839XQX8_9PSEU|nr:TIGR03619 family F420-dependent LLM class oxidoreductase [Prauserella sediminis]MBB3665610.1 putative F420-dependent oxidoreductase [Prauserella sediminis]